MWVLGLLAGIFALILFVPVRVSLRLKGPGWPAWEAEIAWAGGLLGAGWNEQGRYLFAGRLRWPLAPNPSRPVDLEAGGERLWWLWRQAGAKRRRAFSRLTVAAWKGASFSARGAIVYGFADPALTAWLHGLLCALGTGTGFSAEADFTRVGWEGDLEATCSLRPSRIWWPAFRFITVCWWTKERVGGKKIWQVQI